jgi:hypothetical protein
MIGFQRVSRAVLSTECQCGADKRAGDGFCRSCWFKLPESFQSRLFHVCRPTRAAKYMSQQAKALIFWRCLVQLGFEPKPRESAENTEVVCGSR